MPSTLFQGQPGSVRSGLFKADSRGELLTKPQPNQTRCFRVVSELFGLRLRWLPDSPFPVERCLGFSRPPPAHSPSQEERLAWRGPFAEPFSLPCPGETASPVSKIFQGDRAVSSLLPALLGSPGRPYRVSV